jgi:hypothetical protein
MILSHLFPIDSRRGERRSDDTHDYDHAGRNDGQ